MKKVTSKSVEPHVLYFSYLYAEISLVKGCRTEVKTKLSCVTANNSSWSLGVANSISLETITKF